MPDKTQVPIGFSPPAADIGAPQPRKENEFDDEEAAKAELARITPPNEKLLELAKKYPPPPEYFEGDEEIPFDPVEE